MIIRRDLLDTGRGRTSQTRAKDNPYGLAPIRVTDSESKPSTLATPETSVVRAKPTMHGGLYVF